MIKQSFRKTVILSFLLISTSIQTKANFGPYSAVTTLAGNVFDMGSVDGTGGNARFNIPMGIAYSPTGSCFYITDFVNHTIRQMTKNGGVTTISGVSGSAGSNDGQGTGARYNSPVDIVSDGNGVLYITDTGNMTIRQLQENGYVTTTLSGSPGVTGDSGGTLQDARFYEPSGITVDSDHCLYITDSNRNTVRKINIGGNEVTTFAGTSGVGGSDDGTPGKFNAPMGITLDQNGKFFVVDSQNLTIRQTDHTQALATLAGTAGDASHIDGNGASARFYQPLMCKCDSDGNIFVTDRETIRKITPAGVVTTFAGGFGEQAETNGTLQNSRFSALTGLTFDNDGNLYVIDGNAIRKISNTDFIIPVGETMELSENTTLAKIDGAVGSIININDKTLTCGGSEDSTFRGRLEGNGTLNKVGAGRINLTKLDEYEGQISINEGAINYGLLNQTDSSNFRGDLLGDKTFIKTGEGTLLLSGNNDEYEGKIEIEQGKLAIANPSIGGANEILIHSGILETKNIDNIVIASALKTGDLTQTLALIGKEFTIPIISLGEGNTSLTFSGITTIPENSALVVEATAGKEVTFNDLRGEGAILLTQGGRYMQ